MRLIDADKATELLHTALDPIANKKLMLLAWDMVLKNCETIDAEPVRHGRWEDKKVAFYLKCSECGATVRKNLYEVFLDCDIRDLNYCPHCGARMEGVEE